MTSRRRMLSVENLTSKGVINGEIQDDWDQIVKICNAGRAQDFYSIGDWKGFDYSGESQVQRAVLLGFNKEIRTGEPSFANTTWLSTISTPISVSQDESWRYGLVSQQDALNKFSDIIKNNIKEVNKYCEALGQSKSLIWGSVVIQHCKLWALGEYEARVEEIYGSALSAEIMPTRFYDYRVDDVMGQTQFCTALRIVNPNNFKNYSGSGAPNFARARWVWYSNEILLWWNIDLFDYQLDSCHPCFCL